MFQKHKTKIWTVALLCVAVLLLLSTVFAPVGVAYASWEDGYTAYLSNLPGGDNKDWYFGDKFLNLEGAQTLLNGYLTDSNFDKDSLKADPIVIAVIDSGIGYAYKTNGESEIPVASQQIYSGETPSFKLHPIFDDVLLKDKEGRYVYKNFASTVTVKQKDKLSSSYNKVVATYNGFTNTGNIAQDLVDDTSNDHGTHCTGIIAMLIHKLGLEDYVKILPIKANTVLNNDGSNYYAAYSNSIAEPVIDSAIQYAKDNGADIVNLSLSAPSDIKDLYTFSQFTDDMVLVAAAGNDSDFLTSNNRDTYPAACEDVIGVMNYTKASSSTVELSTSSLYGSWYDVAAPGTDIISSINGKSYGKLSGTSMATPITAFTSALAYFRYRGYNGYGSNIALTSKVVRNMVTHGISNKTTSANTQKQVSALNLTDVLTYNFYGDIEFINKIMEEPQGVEITSTAKSEYTLGKGDAIRLTAKTTPVNTSTKDRLYWWYEIGEEVTPIGYGWELDFTVPNKVGMYRVKCAIVDSDDTQYVFADNTLSFSVVYAGLSDLEMKIKSQDGSVKDFINLPLIVGGEYTFTVPLNNVNDALTYDVVWYINGEEVAWGEDFVFTPQTEGEFVLTVKVNGQVVGEETLTATTEIYTTDDLPPALIAGIVIVATAGVAGVVILVVYLVRHFKGNPQG